MLRESNQSQANRLQPSGVHPGESDNLQREVTEAFHRSFSKLMVTFLETPREHQQELRAFSQRAAALGRITGALPFDESREEASHVVRAFMVELLHLGKLELTSILTHTDPLARAITKYDESYRRTADYFLSEQVESCELSRLADVAENILPGYIQSPSFLNAIVARTKRILSDNDRSELIELGEFFDEIAGAPGGSHVKFEIIRATRAEAEETALGQIGRDNFELLSTLFWLDEFWREPEAQDRIAELCRESLAQHNPSHLTLLLQYYPISPETRESLRDEVAEMLGRERVRLKEDVYSRAVSSEYQEMMAEAVKFLHDFFSPRMRAAS